MEINGPGIVLHVDIADKNTQMHVAIVDDNNCPDVEKLKSQEHLIRTEYQYFNLSHCTGRTNCSPSPLALSAT